MSRTWKWILGILAVLLVAGLIVGAGFMWRNHVAWWSQGGVARYAPGAQQVPGEPYAYERYPRYHMDGWGGRMPMMYGGGFGQYGYTPFGMGFFVIAGLFRLIVPLGILALVAYVFYGMGKRAGAGSVTTTPSDPKSLPSRKVASR